MTQFPIPRADEFLDLIRARLPEKTVAHSISVAEYMVSIADQAGISPEQAATAGLLHDLCKPMKKQELLEEILGYGLSVSASMLDTTQILHGPVAAAETRSKLGIDDPDIYEAIYWHTTGIPEWNNVGLALYLADFSESLRTNPQASEAREIMQALGFREALVFVVEEKLAYVARTHTLDPTSLAFGKWVREVWAA